MRKLWYLMVRKCLVKSWMLIKLTMMILLVATLIWLYAHNMLNCYMLKVHKVSYRLHEVLPVVFYRLVWPKFSELTLCLQFKRTKKLRLLKCYITFCRLSCVLWMAWWRIEHNVLRMVTTSSLFMIRYDNIHYWTTLYLITHNFHIPDKLHKDFL